MLTTGEPIHQLDGFTQCACRPHPFNTEFLEPADTGSQTECEPACREVIQTGRSGGRESRMTNKRIADHAADTQYRRSHGGHGHVDEHVSMKTFIGEPGHVKAKPLDLLDQVSHCFGSVLTHQTDAELHRCVLRFVNQLG